MLELIADLCFLEVCGNGNGIAVLYFCFYVVIRVYMISCVENWWRPYKFSCLNLFMLLN